MELKIEAIPNRGPASLGPEIEDSLGWAHQVRIASAFMTSAALEKLGLALEQARDENWPLKIKLLVGLYQRFTPPKALDDALNLQQQYPEEMSVRIARNYRFHWKMYIFDRDAKCRLYVGSANFTQDGLIAEGELLLKVATSKQHALVKSVDGEFEYLWGNDEHSLPLDQLIVQKYRQFKRPANSNGITKDDPLKGLLNSPRRYRPIKPIPKEKRKVRYVFLRYQLREETAKKVTATKNNWDLANWEYACLSKRDYEAVKKSGVFLCLSKVFDVPNKYQLEFCHLEANAIIKTSEGKYFIAYTHLSRSWHRDYDVVKDQLRSIGLNWIKLQSDRYLNQEQLSRICSLLHISSESIFTSLKARGPYHE